MITEFVRHLTCHKHHLLSKKQKSDRVKSFSLVTWRHLEWQPVSSPFIYFPPTSLRDFNFYTFLSCLYWGSALLYLIVDIFFVVLLGQLDVTFETSRSNGHDRHLITELVAMAQRVAVC